MHNRGPLRPEDQTANLKAVLVGGCAEAAELIDRLPELDSGQVATLLMHCSPESVLRHEPDCPIHDLTKVAALHAALAATDAHPDPATG